MIGAAFANANGLALGSRNGVVVAASVSITLAILAGLVALPLSHLLAFAAQRPGVRRLLGEGGVTLHLVAFASFGFVQAARRLAGLRLSAAAAAGLGILAALLAAALLSRFPSRWFRLGLAAVALGLLAIGTLFGWRWPGAPPMPPAGLVGRPREPLLVVAFDGLSHDTLERLVARGDLPTFGSLMRTGAWGPLQTLKPTLSPILWTTIATGRRAEDHGILGFKGGYLLPGVSTPLLRLPPGPGGGASTLYQILRAGLAMGVVREAALASDQWQAPPIWSIASSAGLRVAAINWWASWPAESVNGVVVTDRFYPVAQSLGALPPGLVHPDARAEGLRALLVRPEQLSPQAVETFVRGGSVRERPQLDTTRPLHVFRDTAPRESLALAFHVADLTHQAIAEHLLAEATWDLLLVYFRGVDVVSHLMGGVSNLHGGIATDRAAADRFGHTLEAYYRVADSQLGALLARVPAGTNVLVCSDHGFAWDSPEKYSHLKSSPPGVFLLSGPAAAQGQGVSAGILDLAPAMLYLLGLPVARDMPGRVPEAALRRGLVGAHPVERIDTYQGLRRAPESRRVLPIAPEVEEELKALGYVG